ncbi:MAG: ABC transporter substrate-binding protein [Chloroflexota bacterium]|nr:ABC transporter substrate-binding protein [Chloroflexota bacterium]
MGTERRTFSRREFLARNAWAVGLALAACGAPSPSAQPAESKPAAQPTSPPAGTTAAAATPATQAGAAAPGVFNVWFSANWNEVTDKAVGETFVEWGKTKNIKVEWQSIPGSPQQLAKESAALAAGQPPELNNANRTYWYSQGEMADLKDLVYKFKDLAGGMYEIAISSNLVADGGVIGAPYAVDVWPAHWRMDVIGAATGGRFFDTYEELTQLGPKVQQPPRNYLFAMALGHEGDHLNNIVTTLWAYGGRIADEKGVPDIKNPANKAGIQTIVDMWKAKVIPPDTFAQTVTSWNNETFQKGRGLLAVNPATIMGWLLVNDKDLADKTGLSLPPKGTAGAFAEGTSIAFNYFKKAPLASQAPSALEFFLQPERLEAISRSVEGRFVPVYRDHAKTDFWSGSKFAELKRIAEFGRTREWPSAPIPWLADVQDARYTLSDMMQKIINENMAIEDAQAWAQQQMMDSYSKLTPKA